MTAAETLRPPAAPVDPAPEDRLMEMITGKWTTFTIGAAAELGLADILAAKPRSVEELAREIGAHAPTLRRLLRALAGAGIFREVEPGRFAMTPLAQPLRSDAPGSLRAFARMLASPYVNRPWERLAWAVRTGKDPFEDLHGTDLFGYYASHPEDARVFDEAMTGHVMGQAEAVVGAYDFSPFRRVVDVGGGHGALLAAILRANPRAKGVVLDLPRVADGARERLREAGLAGRAEATGGDFFLEVPAGGDAYLLSFVLHDWPDEKAGKILGNVRKAMPSGAKLLLVEYVVPEGDEPHFSKFLDLEMLVGGGAGRERTRSEYARLLEDVGLGVDRVVATAAGASVIEVTERR